MIIDSSAVIAILKAEPPAGELLMAVAGAASRQVSAANLLEIYMVVDRTGAGTAPEALRDFLMQFPVSIAPVTVSQVELARVAFQHFGKGSGHRAGLNYGDCFAYALAKETGQPLLYIGNDFAATDIPSALATS